MQIAIVFVLASAFALFCESFELNSAKMCFSPEENMKNISESQSICAPIYSSYEMRNQGVELKFFVHINTTTLDISSLRINFSDPLPPILKEITNLIASNNVFEQIPKDFFKNYQNLTYIDFSHNNIRKFDENTFSQLNLVHLNVSFNRLINLTFEATEKWGGLNSLDLSNNQIKNFEIKVKNLSGLKLLDLSNNHIKIVNADFLAKFLNLEELHLENNQITNIEMKSKLNKITYMNIAANEIPKSNISNIIKNLGQTLKKLDLSGNPVGNVTDLDFVGNVTDLYFNNLEYLNLSHTKLTLFKPENLQALKILDLSHNNLTNYILSYNSTNLEWLNLNDNDLNDLENIKRELFPNILTLDISSNYIPKKTLDAFMMEWKNVKNITDPYFQKKIHSPEKTSSILLIIFAVVFCIFGIVILLKFKVLPKIWQKLNARNNRASINEHKHLTGTAQYKRNIFEDENIEFTEIKI